MELNLPKYEVKIRKEGNATKIFDVLRNKFVALTPEEWVRQHFVHFLINEKSYPASLMGNEIQLNLNGMSKRCTQRHEQTMRHCSLRPLAHSQNDY